MKQRERVIITLTLRFIRTSTCAMKESKLPSIMMKMSVFESWFRERVELVLEYPNVLWKVQVGWRVLAWKPLNGFSRFVALSKDPGFLFFSLLNKLLKSCFLDTGSGILWFLTPYSLYKRDLFRSLPFNAAHNWCEQNSFKFSKFMQWLEFFFFFLNLLNHWCIYIGWGALGYSITSDGMFVFGSKDRGE